MSEADAASPRPVDETDLSDAGQKASGGAGAPHLVALNPEAGGAANENRPRDRLRGRVHTASIKLVAPSDSEQLARAVAEVEKASAALRRSQPALELWRPGLEPRHETRPSVSVWMLIGGVWVSAILVLSAAIGAIFYLFG